MHCLSSGINILQGMLQNQAVWSAVEMTTLHETTGGNMPEIDRCQVTAERGLIFERICLYQSGLDDVRYASASLPKKVLHHVLNGERLTM